MGKFSGSLEKAGFDIGLEDLDTSPRQREEEKPVVTEKIREKEVPAPTASTGKTANDQSALQKSQPLTKTSARQTSPQPQAGNQPKSIQGRPGVWDERLFKAVNDDIYLPEIFKIIRSRILSPGEDGPPPITIMITSVVPKEGKSFITANLGISLARGLDQHCLMVDCDLRRPSLNSLFGLKQGPGLAEYLRDEAPLTELITPTDVNKLSILTSGTPPVNPAELLSSARMQNLIDELSSRYNDRIILFDTPPMLIAAETSLLASQADKVLLVVRQGKAGKEQVHKLIETIGPNKILGVVFNDYTSSPFEKNLEKGYGYYRGGYS